VHGTKTLLIEHSTADDDMWIYLPAMKKVRRLVASNKKDSFVGTDFSYGDVIGHKVEDWNHKTLRQEKVDGRDCYVVESTPKRSEVTDNTGYSKRISWIDTESYVAVRGEIYDQNGELLKRQTAQDVERVDPKNNRYQPMKLVSENVQTGHKTIIEFKHFKANVGVGDEVFAARSLEN
jgi:outer membrane lipoprotein-sorting protein